MLRLVRSRDGGAVLSVSNACALFHCHPGKRVIRVMKCAPLGAGLDWRHHGYGTQGETENSCTLLVSPQIYFSIQTVSWRPVSMNSDAGFVQSSCTYKWATCTVQVQMIDVWRFSLSDKTHRNVFSIFLSAYILKRKYNIKIEEKKSKENQNTHLIIVQFL